MDVTRGRKTGRLRGLHRHGGPFAEGAIEHEAFPGRLCQLLQQPIGPQAFLDIRIRDMQGAGNNPLLPSLLSLPQIDQGNVGLVEEPFCLLGADRPAFAGDDLLGETNTHIGGTATSIILGLGRLRLFISATYSSIDST